MHEDDIRFDPSGGADVGGVALHLTWSKVTAVRWRRGFLFGRLEVVHEKGVELYSGFGARRLARQLEAVRSDHRPGGEMPLAA